MFDALTRWFGRTRGGVAHATIGASAVFAAVSGSSLATAATMGQVACPEMTSRGYSTRLTYGVVAAGATFGILIPPSIAMIIYGTTVGVPVTQLFIAGIIPGLLLSLGFMGGVALWATLRPQATPAGRELHPQGEARGDRVGPALPRHHRSSCSARSTSASRRRARRAAWARPPPSSSV